MTSKLYLYNDSIAMHGKKHRYNFFWESNEQTKKLNNMKRKKRRMP